MVQKYSSMYFVFKAILWISTILSLKVFAISYHPEKVGYCEDSINKKMKSKMSVKEKKIDFKINFNELSKGKLQIHSELLSPSQLSKNSFFNKTLNQTNFQEGILLINKFAFFINKPNKSFFQKSTFNHKRFVEQVMHRTTFIRNDGSNGVKLQKSVKLKLGFWKKEDAFTFQYFADVLQNDDERIDHIIGEHPELLSRPKRILHIKMRNPTGYINGGGSFHYYFPVQNEQGEKVYLVLAYQILSINQKGLIKKLIKTFSSNFKNKTNREIAKYVDRFRLLSHQNTI